MSRAEERAKEYAEKFILTVDHQSDVEEAYIDGYHQAEKDLELTLEQIYSILYFEREVLREFGNQEHLNEEVCKEVLKRFKDLKNGTTKR